MFRNIEIIMNDPGFSSVTLRIRSTEEMKYDAKMVVDKKEFWAVYGYNDIVSALIAMDNKCKKLLGD